MKPGLRLLRLLMLCGAVALAAPAFPTPADAAPDAAAPAENAALPDKPIKISERHTPVAVEYKGDDSIGSRLSTRVKELLKIVGLEDKARVYPIQLSGGQRQRVAIARALASDPEVLLCDEATSALDPMTTQSILKLLQDINKELGITIVVITHEMAVIRQICTHVAILDGGVIAEEGSVDEMFTHTKSAAGRRLFGIVAPESEEVRLESGTPPVRLVFDGEQISEPVVANLILKLGLPVSILSANVRSLNGKQFGQMIIELPEDPVVRKTAMDYLREQGVSVEEVHP